MINLDERHLNTLRTILKPYDYTFNLFGSRITGRVKKFSDIDLFYTENIPSQAIGQLQEDLEESDLPYKVDLVDYKRCDPEFQELLNQRHCCLQASSRLLAYEDLCRRHFSVFPSSLNKQIVRQDGAQVIKSNFTPQRFNVVCGSLNSPPSFWRETIKKIIEMFGEQPFSWHVSHSTKTPDFVEVLQEMGFVRQDLEYEMILNLTACPKINAYLQVQQMNTLSDKTRWVDYWAQLEPAIQSFSPDSLTKDEDFFLGTEEEIPIVMGNLLYPLTKTTEQICAAFNVLTRTKSKRQEYKQGLISSFTTIAQQNGMHFMALSADHLERELYQKLGFDLLGITEIFTWP